MMPELAFEDGVHGQVPPHVKVGNSCLYLPAAQSVQVLLDANAEYLPAPQSMQVSDAVAPGVAEYLPGAQL